MKRIITFVALCAALISCRPTADRPTADAFVRIDGTDLVQPDGQKLFIRGTNLGNWLNPEGYMFGFSRTNSPHMIDLMLRQAVGPDAADEFWQRFKDSYITREDIRFIASTGANTIRLPFNYRMFTDEDYMGLKASQDGFARVDELVEWCREEGLYLILDMHDAPGGQTGDNIDDSYGYPWLFERRASVCSATSGAASPSVTATRRRSSATSFSTSLSRPISITSTSSTHASKRSTAWE